MAFSRENCFQFDCLTYLCVECRKHLNGGCFSDFELVLMDTNHVWSLLSFKIVVKFANKNFLYYSAKSVLFLS